MHCTVYVLCIIYLFVYFVPDKHEKTANFIKINSQPLQNINSLQMQQSAAKWVFFVYALCMLLCQCIQILCASVSVAYKWAEHVILYNFKCLPSKWEKNSFPFVCLCLHLFRINNMQVVVIAVIVAHKQPSDYYNALCLTLPLPFFIRWIIFFFVSFESFVFQMASGNGMEWHIIKLDRIEYLRLSHDIYEHFAWVYCCYNWSPHYFIMSIWCSFRFLLYLSLVYSHSFMCRLASRDML